MQLKRYYRAAVREAVRPLFGFFERLGVHVTPIHFYQPIPDTATLPDTLWSSRSALVGIDMRDAAQLALLDNFRAYKSEYDTFSTTPNPNKPTEFHLNNGSYESVDAEVYYAMLRHLKPRRVIEIGSGNSTLVAASALRKNAEEGQGQGKCEYIVTDPFPRPFVAAMPEIARVIAKGVEDCDLSLFESLGDGDILFIDSSHVVRIGGDVVYEILDLLPRLNPGVTIHFHDIFLPLEYPKPLIDKQRWFWSEQYLLQAFLAFNTAFEVVCANAYLAATHPDSLAAAFASFQPGTRPGGFWIQRTEPIRPFRPPFL